METVEIHSAGSSRRDASICSSHRRAASLQRNRRGDLIAEEFADIRYPPVASVVLGYRREWELKKLLLGSVCNYVTHHSTSPVMIVRNFKPRLVEGVTLLAQQQSARPKAAPSK